MVVLPGIAEALLHRRAMGWVMRRLWSQAAARYRLTVLSAREAVPPGFTVEQMAEDAAEALAALRCEPRLTVGVDAGGLVGRWLACRRPDRVGALALLSSPLSGQVPEALGRFLDRLISLLRAGDWPEAFDAAAAVYLDPELRRRLRRPLWMLRRWGRPDEDGLQRGIRLLGAYRSHDALTPSGPARVPVLAVCGSLDPLLGQAAPGGPLQQAGSTAAWVRPARQVWLAGAHGALLRFWPTVLAELRRFEQDAAASSGAALP